MDGSSQEQREHDLTMHVFSISAAMVGVCLTGIGILRLVDVLFMVALVVMVGVCAIIAYALV